MHHCSSPSRMLRRTRLRFPTATRTHVIQDEVDALQRRKLVAAILSGFGLVNFISMLSSIFRIIGITVTERASGMAQLLDVMTGGAASARVSRYAIAFILSISHARSSSDPVRHGHPIRIYVVNSFVFPQLYVIMMGALI